MSKTWIALQCLSLGLSIACVIRLHYVNKQLDKLYKLSQVSLFVQGQSASHIDNLWHWAKGMSGRMRAVGLYLQALDNMITNRGDKR